MMTIRTRAPTAFNRMKLAVVAFTLVALAALIVLRVADLWWWRSELLDAGDRRAGNLTMILSAYVRGTLAASDASLRQLTIEAQRIGGAQAPAAVWAPIVGAAQAALPGITSVSIVDAAGIIRHSTQPRIIGQSRRDEYVFHQLATDSSQALVVSTPIFSFTDPKQLLIPLGRRLNQPDGSFDGIVATAFSPSALRSFFQTVNAGREGVVWVLHPDGLVLFREPSTTNPIGERVPDNPIVRAASRAPTGSLRGPIGAGGPVLLTAYHQSAEPALIVAVSLSQREILAEWWRQVTASLAVLALLGFAAAATWFVLFRQIDARDAAEQALSRAQRLESIGRLTGGVAHDFNNMLTVILGNTSILRERAEPAQCGCELDQIEEAARRAADLTRRLLAFARRQPLQPAIVDLNDLTRDLHPMLVRLLGEDITVALRPGTAPCLANVDAVQVESALMNLCVNARHAMPHGGLLSIETGDIMLDEAYARGDDDVTAGPHVMISVSDTGTGIAREHLAHIFEPFFTTKGAGQGTGLGLSMVYGMVRQSHGHARVYSEVGHGTTFKLYFPAAAGVAAPRAPAPSAACARGQGERILLVEDEDGVRRLAVRMLEQLGYQVTPAASAAQALEMARDMIRIDLLFTDVVLTEGLNGLQLADELTRQRPGMPVLYTSGYSEEILHRGGHVERGSHLITKPYDRIMLAQAVGTALKAALMRSS
jgi:signal transduction histidine kinase/ActR/RegA family two-component response regulator